MKRIFAAVAAFATLLVLTACGDSLDQGVITKKNHSSGYFISQPVTCGNGCTTMIMTWVPESWSFNLKDCETEDGKCRTGSHDVSEKEYDRYKVGDTYGK